MVYKERDDGIDLMLLRGGMFLVEGSQRATQQYACG